MLCGNAVTERSDACAFGSQSRLAEFAKLADAWTTGKTRLLVTCRDPEVGLDSSGLTVRSFALGELLIEEGLMLLIGYLDKLGVPRSERKKRGWTADELRPIVQGALGHPLALELLTPHVKTLGPQTVIDDLGQLLASSEQNHHEGRNRSIGYSLEFSIRHLTDASRAVLPAIALLSGGCIDKVAQEATGLDDTAWQTARAEFERLGLIRVDEPWLRPHPVLDVYSEPTALAAGIDESSKTTATDAGRDATSPEEPDRSLNATPEASANGSQVVKPWSMKSMIRLLVMSDAFRQSSKPNPDGLAKDANAALLWRFPPKRVEAEVIRDSILQASAALDPTIGGRSYRIHNEKKTYAQWKVLNNHGPETWRRLLYQERMRRVDDGIFTAFDFPDCGQVRAKRPVSTTPLQALNLMNSDFVLEQSKRIANRAKKEAGGDAGQSVDRSFELLLGRQPNDQERQACVALAKENDLSLVCRALINSNEFAFLP